ncbi:MAG: YdeI/OmpD-associated family protein [Chloroflexota bacterium]
MEWIEEARKPETRQRRIDRAIEELRSTGGRGRQAG